LQYRLLYFAAPPVASGKAPDRGFQKNAKIAKCKSQDMVLLQFANAAGRFSLKPELA